VGGEINKGRGSGIRQQKRKSRYILSTLGYQVFGGLSNEGGRGGEERILKVGAIIGLLDRSICKRRQLLKGDHK